MSKQTTIQKQIQELAKGDKKDVVLQDPDPVLREKSKPISEITEDIKILAKVLKGLANKEEDGIRTVGMSAIQVGIPLRIATCYNPNSRKTHVLINPVVTAKSEKLSGYWEACASIGRGGDQLFGKVYRPERVTIEYTNLKGETRKKKAKGFFAHVIQHEIDHMNGILFIDHVKEENLWKYRDLDAYLKEHGKNPPA